MRNHNEETRAGFLQSVVYLQHDGWCFQCCFMLFYNHHDLMLYVCFVPCCSHLYCVAFTCGQFNRMLITK